jgi:hypothetical protein
VVAVDPPNGCHLERHLPIGSDVIPARHYVPMPSPSSVMSQVFVTPTHSGSVHCAASRQCNDPAAVTVLEKFPSPATGPDEVGWGVRQNGYR